MIETKYGEHGQRESTRVPSSSETEMERTEETELKAAAEHGTVDPSHVRRTKVSLICSPQRQGGPSCDERQKDGGSTKRDER